MKSHARVAIIGGGVVGVSILYHLTKLGWRDVVLLEKHELTSGSTWHAAGLLPLFNMSYTVGQLHKYSVDLYQELEAETGQAVSFHKTGNLRLATNAARMDEYRKYCGTANTIGVPYEIITPKQIKELWPLCKVDDLVGALFHPQDGHVAPVDVTNAFAKGARSRGAEINRHTEVMDIRQKATGEWLLTTSQGELTAEIVVSATGNYARETAAMVGLDIPVIPVEHQYIVTDEIPELIERKKQGLPELAVLRESDASYYMREERQGLILGPYEKGAPCCWDAEGVPAGFGQELLPPDYDRLQPHIEAAIARVPIFGEAGIKDCVNGPIAYTPDGNPMLGPAYGLKNFWFAEGFSFGITAAGGAGKLLSEWIVEGEPETDPMAVDPRRFGGYANKEYARRKNEETYEHIFIIHYPTEERPASRPSKTSPVHDLLDAAGAVWGQRYGWERPNWFAAPGETRGDELSFRRSNWFEPVGRECRLVRENAGVIDITSFSKFEVSGPGAEGFLDRLVARKLPQKPGRIHLAHALNERGGVRSEFTIMRDGPERFYLVSSGAAERFDHDLLLKRMPDDGSVRVDNVTTAHGVLVLVGPRARDILQKLTRTDLSNEAFPWLTGQQILVGHAPCRAMRINFVGDLGWELHHPIEYQRAIYNALMQAGAEYGIGNCGMRAMDSLRLEKSYRMWGQDLTREYTILEAGLDRFVHLDKGPFPGREALIRQMKAGLPRHFVTLECEIGDSDPSGSEPLYANGSMVGRTTAGAYGYMVGKPLALAYVETSHAAVGTSLEIEILGERYAARIIPESPYDPENTSLRGLRN
ncbi:GcvT family protein [Oceanibacterium hippocampi]|uniref:4-methylaminobutanoate oxidase (Formaldehyde-forming) n=1 Tax=Oceanibacterium hippocampi TaxID=745714 RepID=A0A1Y5SPN9_9PROT|nr:FAD-dependent oxidoreductase [Oceanibacterium hippocampi]SLN42487.1 4-methylaminobutanoate oxidase (formaldehyde-forming) [Oceanibacterium hippocampi]